jgi:hypothetical protein
MAKLMPAETLKRSPLDREAIIPLLATSPMDDLSLFIVLMPLWWYLGVEQIIWPIGLLVVALKVIWRHRGRVVVPRVVRWFFFFLCVQLLSGFFIEESYRWITFLRNFSTSFSAFLLLVILVNCVNTWREIQKLIRALLFSMGVAALIGLLGITGVWQPDFQPSISTLLPDWIKQTSFGSRFAQRSIGHSAFFLFFPYYRVRSIFLFATLYATALAVSLPVVMYVRQSSWGIWRRMFWTFIVGLLFVNLVFTTGRMALTAFIGGWLFFILFVRHRHRPSKLFFIFLFASCAMLISLAFFMQYGSGSRINTVMEGAGSIAMTRSTNERLSVYAITIEEALKKPVFGWATERDIPGLNLPLGSSSFYLALLFRHGIVGFIVFAIMLLSLWRSTRPFDRINPTHREAVALNQFLQYGRWSLVIALLDGMTTSPIIDATTMVVLWLIFSLLVAARRIGCRMNEEDRTS